MHIQILRTLRTKPHKHYLVENIKTGIVLRDSTGIPLHHYSITKREEFRSNKDCVRAIRSELQHHHTPPHARQVHISCSRSSASNLQSLNLLQQRGIFSLQCQHFARIPAAHFPAARVDTGHITAAGAAAAAAVITTAATAVAAAADQPTFVIKGLLRPRFARWHRLLGASVPPYFRVKSVAPDCTIT